MSYQILNNLTIVIPTHNRHKYLKRTIKYWANCGAKLLVLDGSDIKLEDPSLKEKNTKYIYNPNNFYNRLLSSIKYIDTEFMILGSDDEFYLPSALSSCVAFLTKETSYSSCQGLALGFGTRKNGQEVYGFERYPEFKDLCLNHDNALERIEKHFSNYTMASTWSVMRSSNWKLICKHIFEKEYNFAGGFELQIEFLALVLGKSKIIPELMWMRNNDVPPIRGTDYGPSWDLTVLIPEWWHSSYYKKEKNDFLYRMKRACDELSTTQDSKFTEDIIAKLFECFINNYPRKVFSTKILNLIQLLKNLIKSILPWHEIRTKKYNNLVYETKILESQGYKVNHQEISRIISILLDPRN